MKPKGILAAITNYYGQRVTMGLALTNAVVG